MSTLLTLFGNNILPIFLAAGCGYLAAKTLKLSPRSISQAAFYIFAPCLIFGLLTTTRLESSDISRMVAFAAVNVFASGLLAWAVGRMLRLERSLLVAMMLTVMFNNAGNFGLSLNLFAFGETALAHAGLYFVTSAVLMFTGGVVLSSLGSSSLRKALSGLIRVPVVYAVALAFLFNWLGWKLPLPLDRTVSLLGSAAIPVLMLVMGVQLGQARFNGQVRALIASSALRLVFAPAIAIGLSVVFGLHGIARQAGIVEAAMPAAIVTTVLASEFDVEPSFVSTTVFVTTLLSPLTVTPLLAYLGA